MDKSPSQDTAEKEITTDREERPRGNDNPNGPSADFAALIDAHPMATHAYAWSSPIDGSNKPRYFAVLHQLPVDSLQAEVRAATIHEFRAKERKNHDD
jgi:hypothetical protein